MNTRNVTAVDVGMDSATILNALNKTTVLSVVGQTRSGLAAKMMGVADRILKTVRGKVMFFECDLPGKTFFKRCQALGLQYVYSAFVQMPHQDWSIEDLLGRINGADYVFIDTVHDLKVPMQLPDAKEAQDKIESVLCAFSDANYLKNGKVIKFCIGKRLARG